MKVARISNGEARRYSTMGSYPLFYIVGKDCDVLCPDCALEQEQDEDTDPSTSFEAAVNWEDGCLFCEECGEQIESAYGDDEIEA